MPEDASLCRIGSISLDPETHLLAGPRGEVTLDTEHFAILEQLMRHPGQSVARMQLLHAAHPDPDKHPGTAEQVLLVLLSELRGTIRTLGDRNVTIVAEAAGAGYVMKLNRQVKRDRTTVGQTARAA